MTSSEPVTAVTPQLARTLISQYSSFWKKACKDADSPPIIPVLDPQSLRTWYILVFGLEGNYSGGEYLFRLTAPLNFPKDPPALEALTPSGLYEPGGPVCISVGEFHPSNWRPVLGMMGFAAQVWNGFICFDDEDIAGSIRLVAAPAAVRARLAATSRQENDARYSAIMDSINELVEKYPDAGPVKALHAARANGSGHDQTCIYRTRMIHGKPVVVAEPSLAAMRAIQFEDAHRGPGHEPTRRRSVSANETGGVEAAATEAKFAIPENPAAPTSDAVAPEPASVAMVPMSDAVAPEPASVATEPMSDAVAPEPASVAMVAMVPMSDAAAPGPAAMVPIDGETAIESVATEPMSDAVAQEPASVATSFMPEPLAVTTESTDGAPGPLAVAAEPFDGAAVPETAPVATTEEVLPKPDATRVEVTSNERAPVVATPVVHIQGGFALSKNIFVAAVTKTNGPVVSDARSDSATVLDSTDRQNRDSAATDTARTQIDVVAPTAGMVATTTDSDQFDAVAPTAGVVATTTDSDQSDAVAPTAGVVAAAAVADVAGAVTTTAITTDSDQSDAVATTTGAADADATSTDKVISANPDQTNAQNADASNPTAGSASNQTGTSAAAAPPVVAAPKPATKKITKGLRNHRFT